MRPLSSSRPPILIPLVVAMAFLMEQLDSTIITTAVPAIAASLHVTPVQMSLAVAAYVLSVAIFIPVSGWLADRYGARRVFVAALAVFTAGSMLCGASQNFPMLVAMRVVQGLGGAMMTPVGRLILLRSFPRSELITAMTWMTIPAMAGPVIGPLLGGVLTAALSWRWIFYVNLPFGLLAIGLALRFVKNMPMEKVAGFDLAGFLMVGTGLGLLQIGLENVSHPLLPTAIVLAAVAGAVVLLAGFGFYATHKDHPVLDLTLFERRAFRVGSLAGGLARIGINAVPFLLPLMLQVGFGLSPIASGSITFASAFGTIAMRSQLARLVHRVGFRAPLIASAVGGSVILAGFALMQPQTPRWMILAWVVLLGLVRSAQFMTSNTLSYSEIPDSHLSRATSMGGALQQLSASLGVSAAAMLLGLTSRGAPRLTPAHFHLAFLLCALIPLVAIPGFLQLSPQDGRRAASPGQKLAEAESQG